MDDNAKFLLMLYGPIIGFVWLVLLFNWVGRRHDRTSRKHRAA